MNNTLLCAIQNYKIFNNICLVILHLTQTNILVKGLRKKKFLR